MLFSLKHPAKYIGKKPRKYIIPAKPLTPMHLQSISGNSPNETDSGSGTGRMASNEQVHMYREMSSGALSRATYNKVQKITMIRCCYKWCKSVKYHKVMLSTIVAWTLFVCSS